MVDRLANYFPDTDRIYGVTCTYWQSVKNGTEHKLVMKLVKTDKCELNKHFVDNRIIWENEYGSFAWFCAKSDQAFMDARKT